MPSGFFETFRLLLSNYFSLAAFFCFLHVCVIGLIVLEILRIDDEIRGLRRWSRTGETPGSSCAGVLHQFVEESRRWGPKGIFVPMTDFSDRLDSYVSGRVETLHSHVNLFLIVGVAGTFFAMFKFAVVAAKGSVDPRLLSRSLAEGISNAFPVGFVGLLLTVVGHSAAFYFEDRLRNAVNLATQTAMRMRQEAGVGIVEMIGEALAPLANLTDTLQGSLKPVIDGFRSQLADTSKLIESQIQPLNSAVGNFGDEVKRLGGATEALAAATRDLPAAMKEAGELQREARESMQGLADVMNRSGTAIQVAAAAIDTASRELNTVPSRLQGTFSEELARMTTTATTLWTGTSQQFFDTLRPACDALTTAGAGLGTASACLSVIPSEISGRLDDALVRLTATAGKGIADLAAASGREITGLAANCLETWSGASRQFFGDLEPACETLTLAGADLKVAAGELVAFPGLISAGLNDALAQLASTAERGAGQIASSYEREITGLSRRSFESWTGACNQFVDRMNESTTAFCIDVGKHAEAASEGLTIASRQITEIGNQFQGQLMTSVAQLYSTSIEQLRPHLRRMDEAVSERYPRALEQIKEACDQTAELKKISAELPADYQRLSDSIRNAASAWERAVENARRQAARSPGDDDLKEIRASLSTVENILGRRLGQPFWKSWFQKNRDRL